MLAAPHQHDVVRSWPTPGDHTGLDAALAQLAGEAATALVGADVETALECRYAGQSHELRVPGLDAFAAEHRRRNGYERPGTPIEVVALRATARRPSSTAVTDLPAPVRPSVTGPAVVAEDDCTIWVPDGWCGAGHRSTGALILQRCGAGQ